MDWDFGYALDHSDDDCYSDDLTWFYAKSHGKVKTPYYSYPKVYGNYNNTTNSQEMETEVCMYPTGTTAERTNSTL